MIPLFSWPPPLGSSRCFKAPASSSCTFEGARGMLPVAAASSDRRADPTSCALSDPAGRGAVTLTVVRAAGRVSFEKEAEKIRRKTSGMIRDDPELGTSAMSARQGYRAPRAERGDAGGRHLPASRNRRRAPEDVHETAPRPHPRLKHSSSRLLSPNSSGLLRGDGLRRVSAWRAKCRGKELLHCLERTDHSQDRGGHDRQRKASGHDSNSSFLTGRRSLSLPIGTTQRGEHDSG